MPPSVYILFSSLAVLLLFVIGVPVLVSRFYRKVDQGRVLIINKLGKDPIVRFTGGLVLPVIHRAEVMDLSLKTIDVDRRGKEGLICRDNIRADIKVTFFVRVNKTADDVLKVAQSIGCARASTQSTIEELFNAKFSEALKTVGKRMDFEELYTKRDDFKSQIIEVIGQDLNGYVLDDCAIDFLEQTPLDNLDANNVLDAHGIRKITEITGEQAAHTNALRQLAIKTMKRQDVEAAEAIFELERQEADAKARQTREIAAINAREEAEASKIGSEERLKSEMAKLRTEEELEVQAQNKQRQVQIAEKNRERAVAVESERVEKDRDLERIGRERETELLRIESQKAVEIEKKLIADVVAGRVAVDKNVAAEEEAIKELRTLSEARRTKDAAVIIAEGVAQEHVVKEIRAAEASEEVAKFEAKRKLLLAEADLEVADRSARAAIRTAEGVQAELAAEGLAAARVKEAQASADEKKGFAEAKVLQQQLISQAKGDEERGLAATRVKEAEAEAIIRHGVAAAKVVADRGTAEASAISSKGEAEARALELRILAESRGLHEKAAAMKELDSASRAHEEFRMRLEKEVEMQKLRLETSQEIARFQSQTMSSAMQSAKINIVGGDGAFFQQFSRAVSLGHSIDAVLDHSEVARSVAEPYLEGNAELRADLLQVLTSSGASTESIKNMSTAAALHQVSKLLSGKDKKSIEGVISQFTDPQS